MMLYPAFLVILLVAGNIGGKWKGGDVDTTGKMRLIEIVAGNSLLY
jgi:hypothetical protein